MITTADALEVMTTIVAAHPRTAPRMDDEEATLATATLWTDLLAEFDFNVGELVEAVKRRAKVCPDAPEIADVIRVARSMRSDQMARGVATSSPAGSEHYPGDAKAAPDPAEYPDSWTAEQRIGAYWFAMRNRAVPRTTAGWEAIAKQLDEYRRENPLALEPAKTSRPQQDFGDKIAAARRSLDAEQVKS